MKLIATLLISLPLLAAPLQVSAAKGGEPGPSDRARERASDNASFKRGHDDYYGDHKQQKHYDRERSEHRHADDYPYRDGRHRDYRERDRDDYYRDRRDRHRDYRDRERGDDYRYRDDRSRDYRDLDD